MPVSLPYLWNPALCSLTVTLGSKLQYITRYSARSRYCAVYRGLPSLQDPALLWSGNAPSASQIASNSFQGMDDLRRPLRYFVIPQGSFKGLEFGP